MHQEYQPTTIFTASQKRRQRRWIRKQYLLSSRLLPSCIPSSCTHSRPQALSTSLLSETSSLCDSTTASAHSPALIPRIDSTPLINSGHSNPATHNSPDTLHALSATAHIFTPGLTLLDDPSGPSSSTNVGNLPLLRDNICNLIDKAALAKPPSTSKDYKRSSEHSHRYHSLKKSHTVGCFLYLCTNRQASDLHDRDSPYFIPTLPSHRFESILLLATFFGRSQQHFKDILSSKRMHSTKRLGRLRRVRKMPIFILPYTYLARLRPSDSKEHLRTYTEYHWVASISAITGATVYTRTSSTSSQPIPTCGSQFRRPLPRSHGPTSALNFHNNPTYHRHTRRLNVPYVIDPNQAPLSCTFYHYCQCEGECHNRIEYTCPRPHQMTSYPHGRLPPHTLCPVCTETIARQRLLQQLVSVTARFMPPTTQLITQSNSPPDHTSFSNASTFDVLYCSSDSDDSNDIHDWMYSEPKTASIKPSRQRNSGYRKISATKRRVPRTTPVAPILCTSDEDSLDQGLITFAINHFSGCATSSSTQGKTPSLTHKVYSTTNYDPDYLTQEAKFNTETRMLLAGLHNAYPHATPSR
jgi:hypothetical protein